MSKNFLPAKSIEEREAAKLAALIADGTVIERPEGLAAGDLSFLPADRDINLSDQLRAARLNELAMTFSLTAAGLTAEARAELITERRFNDLSFHPRYKREWADARKSN